MSSTTDEPVAEETAKVYNESQMNFLLTQSDRRATADERERILRLIEDHPEASHEQLDGLIRQPLVARVLYEPKSNHAGHTNGFYSGVAYERDRLWRVLETTLRNEAGWENYSIAMLYIALGIQNAPDWAPEP